MVERKSDPPKPSQEMAALADLRLSDVPGIAGDISAWMEHSNSVILRMSMVVDRVRKKVLQLEKKLSKRPRKRVKR